MTEFDIKECICGFKPEVECLKDIENILNEKYKYRLLHTCFVLQRKVGIGFGVCQTKEMLIIYWNRLVDNKFIAP